MQAGVKWASLWIGVGWSYWLMACHLCLNPKVEDSNLTSSRVCLAPILSPPNDCQFAQGVLWLSRDGILDWPQRARFNFTCWGGSGALASVEVCYICFTRHLWPVPFSVLWCAWAAGKTQSEDPEKGSVIGPGKGVGEKNAVMHHGQWLSPTTLHTRTVQKHLQQEANTVPQGALQNATGSHSSKLL